MKRTIEFWAIFCFWSKCFLKSSAAETFESIYLWEMVKQQLWEKKNGMLEQVNNNSFLRVIQQFCSRRLWTYLKCQKIENLYNWMDNLWLKVENIVEKEEIARFEQFLLLSLCFHKAVCCGGVSKSLYEGKG